MRWMRKKKLKRVKIGRKKRNRKKGRMKSLRKKGFGIVENWKMIKRKRKNDGEGKIGGGFVLDGEKNIEG